MPFFILRSNIVVAAVYTATFSDKVAAVYTATLHFQVDVHADLTVPELRSILKP